LKYFGVFARAFIFLVLITFSAVSQRGFSEQPAASSRLDGPELKPSRWESVTLYSYLGIHSDVTTTSPYAVTERYARIGWGGVAGSSYFVNKNWGVTFEYGAHPDGDNDSAFTLETGPIYRFKFKNWSPFVHILGGRALMGGPNDPKKNLYHDYTWGPAVTAGAGLGCIPLFFHGHGGIMPFQADYEYDHVIYPKDGKIMLSGGPGDVSTYRLSSGFCWGVGSVTPPQAVSLSCSVSPATVYPGDPVTIAGTADHLNPKKRSSFSWSGVPGVSGTDSTVNVSTASLAPGTYTIQGKVTEGAKAGQSASCSTTMTVKAYEAPTVSCVANPTSIRPGDTSSITATGVSPQNRPLTYSYTASAGTVSNAGNSATYSSAGAAPGPVTVTTTVADDKGQTASCTTQIDVVAPYAAPAPAQSELCSLSFARDEKRPVRVDNEAKACLDSIALTLKSKSDASVVLVGHSTVEERNPSKPNRGSHVENAAAQRAVNAKDYLVNTAGIDGARVAVYTGSENEKKVGDYLVPAGATFSLSGAASAGDDVKPQQRKPLARKPATRKKFAESK